ncbi:hypothetical protein, partial [Pseudomonas aeruginosa]|uniref:hypothetical protein n=1 Tax=Pseudomonas aeruginosa TaxID=287 RepID=UPI001EE6D531
TDRQRFAVATTNDKGIELLGLRRSWEPEVSHDRGSPRSSIPLSLVVATAKRCLSVHNGHTGNFTLFVFKKRAHSGPFFSETSYQD